MFLNKTYTPSKSLQFLWLSKLNYSLLLILMALSFPVFAQEVEDELPAPFFGNWVEDLSECEAGSYFSIADSEIGLLVFGLGWSSTEVKVEKMGDYYMLYVDAISEGGDFQSEIKIKMGEDGNLFFIDSGSEEKELVKCDSIEFFEYESEEMTLADSGLNVVELDMDNTINVGFLGNELPLPFYGNWVEDLSECNGVPPLSINYAEGSLLVSGLDWYSSEVKVTYQDDYYSLTIKGLSEEGEFETEIIIGMDEEENLIVSTDGGETGSLLVKCDPISSEEIVALSDEEMTLDDVGLDVEEFDIDNSLAMDTFNIELIQGKWQSLEDEASFLVIEGDRMKNYYGGLVDELDNEMIMISDTCMNEADSANGLPEEKSRYLSNPNLDRCWYIQFVDATNLSLIYMATGNTLTYRRVE
jgi:hypothetical protein